MRKATETPVIGSNHDYGSFDFIAIALRPQEKSANARGEEQRER